MCSRSVSKMRVSGFELPPVKLDRSDSLSCKKQHQTKYSLACVLGGSLGLYFELTLTKARPCRKCTEYIHCVTQSCCSTE